MRHSAVGSADTPETGLWACLKAHTGTEPYSKIIEGFEPHEHPTRTAPGDN